MAGNHRPLAVVTGGGVRIGREICLSLAAAGFDVVVHANRSVEAALEVAEQLAAPPDQRAWVEVADLSDPGAVVALAERILATHPLIDVLVNNAGVYAQCAFDEVEPAELRRLLAVNVEAPFLLTQRLLPALRRAKGVVVNVTDMAVHHAYTTSHHVSHYAASKAALEQLTRAWALELGPLVRVNAVAPGPVAISDDTTSEQRTEILERSPLRREGSPADVAGAVVFLATAPYITGHSLRVDGGLGVT